MSEAGQPVWPTLPEDRRRAVLHALSQIALRQGRPVMLVEGAKNDGRDTQSTDLRCGNGQFERRHRERMARVDTSASPRFNRLSDTKNRPGCSMLWWIGRCTLAGIVHRSWWSTMIWDGPEPRWRAVRAFNVWSRRLVSVMSAWCWAWRCRGLPDHVGIGISCWNPARCSRH